MVFVAVVLAGVDLAVKALLHADYHHARSPYVVIVTTVVVIGLVAFVPRIASRATLFGASVAVGGALGNVVAEVVWAQGVPDPLVIGGVTGGIAFNLADVFVFTGDALMLSAALVYALRNRAALRTSL